MAYVIGCNGETSRYRPDAARGGEGGGDRYVSRQRALVRTAIFFHRPVAIKSMHIDDIISI